MTLIRVNPESVQAYGRTATSIFQSMHGSLTSLVNEVVGVHYYGPNAVAFKTQSGEIATAFAASLHSDIAAMADAVRASTSNIAASLGGAPISLQVDGQAVTAPLPEAVDYVDVDTSALEALIPVVTSRFESLRSSLDSHANALQSTDWAGNAKEQAVSAVGQFTGSARAKCNEAETSLTTFIRKQIDSVLAADR